MNDSSELEHGRQVFRKHLEELLATTVPEEHRLIHAFGMWLQQYIYDLAKTFAVSFTEDGNLLSQWRGYAPGTTGVSMGFHPKRLQELAPHKYVLAKCVYDQTQQRNYVADLVYEILQSARAQRPPPPLASWGAYSASFTPYEKDILLLTRILKHPAFEQENEWRVVYTVPSWALVDDLDFRSGSSSLIPFARFPLEDANNRLDVLKDITIGPTKHEAQATAAIDTLLEHTGWTKVAVNSCGIPLRQI